MLIYRGLTLKYVCYGGRGLSFWTSWQLWLLIIFIHLYYSFNFFQWSSSCAWSEKCSTAQPLSCTYTDTSERLQAMWPGFLNSNTWSITVKEIMGVLLLHLFRHICCHLGGTFVTYVAQICNSYQNIRLYVALKFAPSKLIVSVREMQNISFE